MVPGGRLSERQPFEAGAIRIPRIRDSRNAAVRGNRKPFPALTTRIVERSGRMRGT